MLIGLGKLGKLTEFYLVLITVRAGDWFAEPQGGGHLDQKWPSCFNPCVIPCRSPIYGLLLPLCWMKIGTAANFEHFIFLQCQNQYGEYPPTDSKVMIPWVRQK